jgi:PEP-CTERM motif
MDGVLTMVKNVMSYDSRGIIVGTTTVVPEPITWMLLMGAVAVPHTLRRRP